MDVRLLVAHSKLEKKEIRLGAETLIGRSPECNLRIASGQVSRRHCLIKVAETVVSVRDLGSANGTRLNGQTIDSEQDVPVPPGSTLVVGPLKFSVQFTPPKAASEGRKGSTEEVTGTLRDLDEMATVPVVDGEETKDYPPTRERNRGAPPPLVVSGELRGIPTDPEERQGGAYTTEADIRQLADETVFDVSLEAPPGDRDREHRGGGQAGRAVIGSETDFVFDEDELSQLSSAVDAETDEAPSGPGAGTSGKNEPERDETAKAEPQGWHLFDMLKRKKKTSEPPSAGHPDDATEEQLRKFLDDA